MKLVRLAVASLVFVGTFAVAGLVTASPASAATCWYRDQGWVDSGVSYAPVYLYYCSDGSHEFRGTLYDTACDNRTAYLDIYPWDGGHFGIHASGCGASTPFTISTWNILAYEVDIRTRACNVTCSSSDWDSLYPYG